MLVIFIENIQTIVLTYINYRVIILILLLTKEVSMGFLKKKWVRALINFVLTLAIFITIASVFDSTNINEKHPAISDASLGVFMGIIAFLGTFVYFIAFDLLGDVVSGVAGFIRIVLLILGTLGILLFGIIGYLGSVADMSRAILQNESPWLFAFSNLWILGALLSFVLFYFAVDNAWAKGFFPFISIVSLIISYFISVIFTYIGNAAGTFFYWLPLILAAGIIVFMIFRIKNEGLPFLTKEDLKWSAKYAFDNSKNSTFAASYQQNTATKTENQKPVDNRLDYNGAAPINKAIYDRIARRPLSFISDNYSVKWESDINYSVLIFSSISITISGNLKYIIGLGNTPSFSDEATAKYYLDSVCSNIESEIRSIIDDVRSKYKGYDSKSCNINCKLAIRVSQS